MKRTVFVGLSGGVDSSLTAALLLEAGEHVVGAFVKIDVPEISACTWREDRLAAKRTAATLGIPFVEYDLSDIHRTTVVDDMIKGYSSGRTPNPDVLCNRTIKFGALWEATRADGATHIATGHYARITEGSSHHLLRRGIDSSKDQSYFLWQLNQNDLSHTIFPLGNYTKQEVRHMAQARSLPSATRPDSQGLCFVGDVSLNEFLNAFVPQEEGDVLDIDHVVVGRHAGAGSYTLGQRHGFTLTHPTGSPQYVIARDIAHNTITISSDIEKAYIREVHLTQESWITQKPKEDDSISTALRYHGQEISGHYRNGSLLLEDSALAAPGQSAVVYEGDVCLGGGIIV